MYKKCLKQLYLESIGSQASLSLSSITKFYISYVKENEARVDSELNRIGYFVLKNKMSIGNSSTTTKDVFISAYFVSMAFKTECNNMLSNKYGNNIDVNSTGGFFIPSTNELVIIIKVDFDDSLEDAIVKNDIRSVIEHEIVHAFDNTNSSDKLSKQKQPPGVGTDFLSACAYVGCASRSQIADIIGSGTFNDEAILACIYSISIVLYKLFTLTEFNAHQVSDLEETHSVNIKKSEEVKRALQRDVLKDFVLTKKHVQNAVSVDYNESPELWNLVGNVLTYMGYNPGKTPISVYKYFKSMSEKLFEKFLNKKLKTQSKIITSLKEKNSIKDKIINCVENDSLDKGVSFWFTPTGDSNSYLCRVYSKNNDLVLSINNKPINIYGNAKNILKRATDAYNKNANAQFEFAIDNLVDIVTQSIERNFKDYNYDPMYDITEPQSEDQIYKSNRVANRFSDLDWD